jgi:hypothetical protein
MLAIAFLFGLISPWAGGAGGSYDADNVQILFWTSLVLYCVAGVLVLLGMQEPAPQAKTEQ